VRGEAQELEIVNQRAPLQPQVARDHGFHLVEDHQHGREMGCRD
jgi:hypothetical protein